MTISNQSFWEQKIPGCSQTNGSKRLHSTDWFKGKIQETFGNPYTWWRKLWFPVDFSFNQSSDTLVLGTCFPGDFDCSLPFQSDDHGTFSLISNLGSTTFFFWLIVVWDRFNGICISIWGLYMYIQMYIYMYILKIVVNKLIFICIFIIIYVYVMYMYPLLSVYTTI